LFIVVASVPIGLTWRQVAQVQLNHALIAAIRRNDTHDVQRLLRQGADANSRYDPGDQRALWLIFLDRLRGMAKPPPAIHGASALLVALGIERRMGSLLPVYEDASPIVQALLDHGADVHVMLKDDEHLLLLAVERHEYSVACLLTLHRCEEQDAEENQMHLRGKRRAWRCLKAGGIVTAITAVHVF
jgi:ankyrin repeat protein